MHRHHRYVGEVSYISIDPSAKSTRGVVVASETGVLAVLDPHYGDIRTFQHTGLRASFRSSVRLIRSILQAGDSSLNLLPMAILMLC